MSEETTIVFGLHAVRTLLKQRPERASRLIVQKGRNDGRISEVVQLAKAANVATESRDRKELDRLAGAERHQGVCLQVKSSGCPRRRRVSMICSIGSRHRRFCWYSMVCRTHTT